MRIPRKYYSKKDKEDTQLAIFITMAIFAIIGYFATHPEVVTMIKKAFIIILTICIIGAIIYFAAKFLSKDTRENLKNTEKHGQINTKNFTNQTNQETKDIMEEYEKIKQESKNAKFQKVAKTEAEKIKKGKGYEYDIKCFFEQRNYKVYPNGYINGVKDEGIDLIAYKDNEAILAQCKNWANPPKQDIIKKFVADADLYINKNQNKFKNKKIRKIFFTSCRQIDYGAKTFLEEYNQYNKIKIEYVIYAIQQI
nr:restriction endonuclease [uncultured Campylobacter sp.]